MGLTAQPVLTLVRTNRRQDLKSLKRVLRKHGCTAIVVGNPLYMSGDLSPQAIKAQAFAQVLAEETQLPVHLWDERLTTTEAHRHLHAAGRAGSEHKQVVDQVAAVLILQSYLDAHGSQIRAEEQVNSFFSRAQDQTCRAPRSAGAERHGGDFAVNRTSVEM